MDRKELIKPLEYSHEKEEVIEMESITEIKLQALEDVKDFVDAASQCDFDIDIYYNRVIVDAKSFLGVLSMDLTRSLTVESRGYDKTFAHTLQKYVVG